jgi:hypothetical protein
MMTTLFISYSRVDEKFVLKLERSLTQLGYSVLLDSKHLRGGRPVQNEISTKISQADFVLPIMTGASSRSAWVMPFEVSYALKLQQDGHLLRVIPILLKKSKSGFAALMQLNYVDFTGDYALALAKLVQSLPNTDYDELSSLRKNLSEEWIDDDTLLNVLIRVLKRRRKTEGALNLNRLTARNVMKEVERLLRDEEAVGTVYWWLIVYGVFKFDNIERFWDDDEDTYPRSIKYAEMAPRGKALLRDLTENLGNEEAGIRRRPAKQKRRVRSH